VADVTVDDVAKDPRSLGVELISCNCSSPLVLALMPGGIISVENS
jgi:hypothetical protein